MKFLLIAFLFSCSAVFAQPAATTGQVIPPPLHDSNVRVAMRDGTELSLEIFRPAAPGQYPTLYAAGPQLFSDAVPDNRTTGPVAWLVAQGYNYVLASVRGTGRSDGVYEFMGRDEQQDHYELIEWIATQQWSDGQVAGIGAGFYGNSQWQMGVQSPPHLSCIAPGEAALDLFADWAWQGGLASDSFTTDVEQKIRLPHMYPPRGDARFLDIDPLLELHQHATSDNWWSLRSPLPSMGLVRVPVLQFGSWQDNQQPWLQALNRKDLLPAATNSYVSNQQGLLQDRAFLENELLPYYRWCFSGRPQTGPALQPAVRFRQVNGETIRASSGWPPANINYTALLLKSVIDEADPDAVSGVLTRDSEMPGRNRSELGEGGLAQLEFISRPLARDVDFAGPVQLELYLSSNHTDTAWQAELYAIQPAAMPVTDATADADSNMTLAAEPTMEQVLISSARVRASVRGDEGIPLPDQSYQYRLDFPQPLYPGRIYRVGIELGPAAWRLKAGSSLQLLLRQTSDAGMEQLGLTQGNDTLYHTSQYPSRLWLPLSADSRLELLPEPQAADNSEFEGIFIFNSFRETQPEAGQPTDRSGL